MIVLLQRSGEELKRALTDAQGRFKLVVPAPGEYTLRADRIGYVSVARPVDIFAGKPLEIQMAVASQPIALSGITVEAEGRCEVRPADGLAVARVWDEARKALAASDWTQRRKLFRYEIMELTRQLDPLRLRVVEESVGRRAGLHYRPFESIPTAALARKGFVHPVEGEIGIYDYFAPDAEVLLSDPFLDTHCMQLVEGYGATAGLMGIAFEPIPDRRVPDIQGTFWLDRESAALRFLDYRYVGLDLPVPTDNIGGRVEFRMLPNGTWIVTRWRIRVPKVALRRTAWAGGVRSEYELAEIREVGGEVTRIFATSGELVETASQGFLAGAVFDSTRMMPLAGAEISLSGTAYTAISDGEGRFRIHGVPEGTYLVRLAHPRLDSLPIADLPATDAHVGRGRGTDTDLTIPPVHRLIAEACPSDTVDVDISAIPGLEVQGRTGVVVGVVRDSGTGSRVRDARITATWSRYGVDFGDATGQGADRRRHQGFIIPTKVTALTWGAEASSDGRGHYVICDLPADVPITVEARAGQLESESRIVKLESDPVGTVDLDLSEGNPAAGGAVVIGFVREAGSGRPLGGASIVARTSSGDTVAAALADGAGRFRLDELEPGIHELEASLLGYRKLVAETEVRAGQAQALDLPLSPGPIELDPVVAEVEAREPHLSAVGYYDRKLQPGGIFIDRKEIEARDANQVTDLLQGKTRVRVVYAGSGGLRADVVMSGTANVGFQKCAPRIVLDGMVVRQAGPMSENDVVLNDLISPNEVAGIEVYRSAAETPPQFGGRNGSCGVVVLWSRQR